MTFNCHTVALVAGNHNNIFQRAGMDIVKYRYYNSADRALDFDGLIADLKVTSHQIPLMDVLEGG